MLHNPVLSQRIINDFNCYWSVGNNGYRPGVLADVIVAGNKPYRNSNGELKVRVVSGDIIFLLS